MTARQGTLRTWELLYREFGTRPFTLREALSVVGAAHYLRQAVVSGRVARVHRGWYLAMEPRTQGLSPELPNGTSGGRPHMQCDDTFSLPPAVAIAISRLRQQGVEPIVAGGVAAQHWGMDSVGPIAPAILLAPSDRGVRPGFRSGVLIRHADLSQSHVVTGPLGLPFTTPVRTGIDCARGRDPLAAFIIVNSAARVTLGLRAGGIRLSAHEITDLATDPDVRAGMQDLVRGVLSECRGHGLASIKAGVHLIEPRLETALESLSWWRFSEAGLTMPVPQQWVQGASGEMYRVDFDCGHVVGEADGRVKYANPQVLWEEKRRQTDIERGGHPVVRWIWDDMWRHPEQVIRTLR